MIKWKNQARIRMVSADMFSFNDGLIGRGIALSNISVVDDITLEATVQAHCLSNLQKYAQMRNVSVELLARLGPTVFLRRMFTRPVLVISILLFSVLSILLPGKILFLEVDGNDAVPSNLILENAYQCGIGVGASRAKIRSEKIKNRLLETMPQLQWVGVNTRGCVAVITVKEKQISNTAPTPEGTVSSIIACADGLVMECTATKGTALCKPGEIVKAGQTLISGFTDCGLTVRAERAEGEVYALTNHKIQVFTPTKVQVRKRLVRTETKEFLLIGKNIINFSNNSRISDATCVKIYDKKALTLPGGFQLPIYRLTQKCYYYTLVPGESGDDDPGWLAEYASQYITAQMEAGQIIGTTHQSKSLDGLGVYEAMYACYEMIGRDYEEEILHGKDS